MPFWAFSILLAWLTRSKIDVTRAYELVLHVYRVRPNAQVRVRARCRARRATWSSGPRISRGCPRRRPTRSSTCSTSRTASPTRMRVVLVHSYTHTMPSSMLVTNTTYEYLTLTYVVDTYGEYSYIYEYTSIYILYPYTRWYESSLPQFAARLPGEGNERHAGLAHHDPFGGGRRALGRQELTCDLIMTHALVFDYRAHSVLLTSSWLRCLLWLKFQNEFYFSSWLAITRTCEVRQF